jgi:hypothetical protein
MLALGALVSGGSGVCWVVLAGRQTGQHAVVTNEDVVMLGIL